MARLLIAGKLVVDDVLDCAHPLTPGSNQRALSRTIHGGGQVWHTARAASAAGAAVTVTGWCGNDLDSSRLRATFTDDGIADRLIALPDPSRSTVLVHADDRVIVSFGGGGYLHPEALDHEAALRDVALLHIDGFALDAVAGDAIVSLASVAAERGIQISLEPPRPSKCESSAPWLSRLPPLGVVLGRPDEISAVFGHLTSPAAITVAHDQDRPVITRQGSTLVTTAVPQVDIASLGAGDRFAGGWLAARLRAADLEAAALAGIAAARLCRDALNYREKS